MNETQANEVIRECCNMDDAWWDAVIVAPEAGHSLDLYGVHFHNMMTDKKRFFTSYYAALKFVGGHKLPETQMRPPELETNPVIMAAVAEPQERTDATPTTDTDSISYHVKHLIAIVSRRTKEFGIAAYGYLRDGIRRALGGRGTPHERLAPERVYTTRRRVGTRRRRSSLSGRVAAAQERRILRELGW